MVPASPEVRPAASAARGGGGLRAGVQPSLAVVFGELAAPCCGALLAYTKVPAAAPRAKGARAPRREEEEKGGGASTRLSHRVLVRSTPPSLPRSCR